ncbi:hypothetical protein NIES2119_00005 [[Phormidium ambiguum] IAM M-71]|uniref:Ice-binding protein C-terminal domain-containing protein n=1 Tax=[Phormidium ambiguum] IAM M-71 TaxID=454136 RepID=A0A1U7ITD6_9CYAN|nr:hypothetical protein [Phormidium ambiguum]OKH40742.1 hypothetical protein NIES2119_00005 [Phormidium ambiguum IAM M-71]
MITLKNLCLAAVNATVLVILSITPAQAFTLYFSPSLSYSLGSFGIGAGSITLDDSVTNLQFGETKTFNGAISSGMATGEYHTYSVTKTLSLTVTSFVRSDSWNFGFWRTNVIWRMNIFCNVVNISSCEGAQGYFFARSLTPYGDPFYDGMVTFQTSPVNQPSVPEPQTAYALMLLGILGLLKRKWKVISGIVH